MACTSPSGVNDYDHDYDHDYDYDYDYDYDHAFKALDVQGTQKPQVADGPGGTAAEELGLLTEGHWDHDYPTLFLSGSYCRGAIGDAMWTGLGPIAFQSCIATSLPSHIA